MGQSKVSEAADTISKSHFGEKHLLWSGYGACGQDVPVCA